MRIERATVDEYKAYLQEPSRPPSRGGNTRAWHSHVLIIGDVRYSFLALGTKKWVFASDVTSFDWEWDETKRYRNIVRDSIQVWDRYGQAVVRGERGVKERRTAQARMPASRREQRN